MSNTQTPLTKSITLTQDSNPVTYTPQGEHPEDRIFKDRAFIKELEKVQYAYYEKLVADLNINKEGSDLLFDYVYNNDEESLSFEEWLHTISLSYESFIKKN